MLQQRVSRGCNVGLFMCEQDYQLHVDKVVERVRDASFEVIPASQSCESYCRIVCSNLAREKTVSSVSCPRQGGNVPEIHISLITSAVMFLNLQIS